MIRSLALAIVLALGAAPALAGDAATQEAPTKVAPKGITWFATLDSARTAAKRTGKAMLITSAAPQCHQVPGIW